MKHLLKKINMLLIVTLVLSCFTFTEGKIYADEIASDYPPFPDSGLLQLLIDKGILIGNGAGDYALDRTITRAEWLTLLKRVMDERKIVLIKPSISTKSFKDLDKHWAKDNIRYWIERGVVVGDAEGNLRLNDTITIAEMLVILDRITQVDANKAVTEASLALYQDHWAYPSLNHLYQKGWVQFDRPIWDEQLLLDRPAVRGEGVLLLRHFYQDSNPSNRRATLASINQLLDQPIDINGDGKVDFSFRLSSPGYSLTKVSETKNNYQHLEEKDWLYEVRKQEQVIGQLRFQLKQVKQQDLIYFLRYTPTQPEQDPISIDLIYYGADTLQGRTPISDIGEEKLPYEWKSIVVDQTMSLPHASVFLEGEGVNLRVGAADTFRNLGYSVRDYQGIDQTESTISKQDQAMHFTFNFTNKVGRYSETWGVLGETGLFDWNRTVFTNFMLRDDTSINKKLSLEGLYYRTPNNYVPRSSYSYYLNPANIMGVRALGYLQKDKTKGRYLDDFVILLGNMAVKNQNEAGYWPTQPKSEWLEKDYQIGYNYFDNRRNADNATFLLQLYQAYPDEHIKKALEKHVQVLYQLIEEHSVHTSEYGLLFTDYIGDEKSEMSHIALNHHLAVVNFLFKWYMLTGDQQADSYALRMIMGIEDTEERWIKENKDLYYALFADLSPHHYPDYMDLTLSDLRITQNLLSQIYGQTNDSLNHLIEAKKEWLAKLKDQG